MIVSDEIPLAVVLIAFHRSYFDEHCFPPAYTFLLRMLHGFSMGLRSREHAGHTIISPFLTRTFFKKSVVKCAACEGALSCMKTIFLRKVILFFFYHGNKCSFRNAMYVGVVILIPSLTRKGPTSWSLMIAAKNITPPPPC